MTTSLFRSVIKQCNNQSEMKGWVFIFGAQGPYLVLISYKIVPLLEPHFTAQGFLQLCSLSEKVARLNE